MSDDHWDFHGHKMDTKGRQAVGDWLRLRMKYESECRSRYAYQFFSQLAADADHSSLLARLLAGEEPLSEEEYRAQKERGEV